MVCSYHPQKLGKIRVVFDCSAQYANMSINTELMSEPDLVNQIVGVLIRFRKENVVFMADIKSIPFLDCLIERDKGKITNQSISKENTHTTIHRVYIKSTRTCKSRYHKNTIKNSKNCL